MPTKTTSRLQRVYREEFDIRKLVQPRVELREEVDEEELEQLGESIADLDMLQPILITVRDRNVYELISGGRRVRSAKKKGRWLLPAYIYDDLPDDTALLMSLVENIQRTDLEPIWEARAYRVMQQRDGKSIEQIAQEVRKPETRIHNRLKLLGLDPEVQRMVQRKELPTSTATVIAEIPDKQAQRVMAQEVKESELSYDVVKRIVHDSEKEARRKREQERDRKKREKDERRRKKPSRSTSPGYSTRSPAPSAQPARSVPVVQQSRTSAATVSSSRKQPNHRPAPSPLIPTRPARPHVLPANKQDALLKEIAVKCEQFLEWLDRIKLEQFDVQHLRDLHLMAYRVEQGAGNFVRHVREEL